MSAVHLGTFEPLSPEWHAARADGIGGSEIAAVLGLSKWESPFSLWHRKAGRIPAQPDSDVMEWGRRLEPAILDRFRDDHPELTVVSQPGTYRNADRPWQIANPDALAYARERGDDALVEVKTAREDWEWGDPGTDQIPPYYLIQTRWYLDVFGLDTAHVAVLIAGSDYREYVVHPDPDDTDLMRNAAADFMASLATGERPDIEGHTETYRAVKQLPTGVIDDGVEIDGALALWYEESFATMRKAEASKREATSRVLDAIGDHRYATCQGLKIATRAITKDGRTHSLKPARKDTDTP